MKEKILKLMKLVTGQQKVLRKQSEFAEKITDKFLKLQRRIGVLEAKLSKEN